MFEGLARARRFSSKQPLQKKICVSCGLPLRPCAWFLERSASDGSDEGGGLESYEGAVVGFLDASSFLQAFGGVSAKALPFVADVFRCFVFGAHGMGGMLVCSFSSRRSGWGIDYHKIAVRQIKKGAPSLVLLEIRVTFQEPCLIFLLRASSRIFRFCFPERFGFAISTTVRLVHFECCMYAGTGSPSVVG